MANLSDIVDGWGVSTEFEEDWMKVLKDHYKK
jgi:simple sugar transport system substrate-binding protein